MKPVSPVIRGAGGAEIVFAKDQPQYIPLPALRNQRGIVTTRWKLTMLERLKVLFGGSIFLQISTCESPLQPVRLSVDAPDSSECL